MAIVRVVSWPTSQQNECGCGQRCTAKDMGIWAIREAAGVPESEIRAMPVPFRVEVPAPRLERMVETFQTYRVEYEVL